MVQNKNVINVSNITFELGGKSNNSRVEVREVSDELVDERQVQSDLFEKPDRLKEEEAQRRKDEEEQRLREEKEQKLKEEEERIKKYEEEQRLREEKEEEERQKEEATRW